MVGVERRGKRKAEEEEQGDLGVGGGGRWLPLLNLRLPFSSPLPFSFIWVYLVSWLDFVGSLLCVGEEGLYVVSFSFPRGGGSYGFKKYGYSVRGKKASGFKSFFIFWVEEGNGGWACYYFFSNGDT